ncbi:YiiX/YebB-like N1pC/P60 family cysteine hydrolase [Petrachloros mirabilis]
MPLLIGLLIAALLSCQSVPSQQCLPRQIDLAPEVTALTKARSQGRALRDDLDAFATAARAEITTATPPSSAVREQVRSVRSQYLFLRQVLFELAFLHAPSIVERIEAQDPYPLLLGTGISVGAGDELVKNFVAISPLLSLHPAFIETWNEPDPTAGTPAGSWEHLLTAYRNPAYLDLFTAAIERLQKNRKLLEMCWEDRTTLVRTLYPSGVGSAIENLQKTLALLGTGIAEEYFGQDERELQALIQESKEVRTFWAEAAPALRAAIERDQGVIRGHVRVQMYQAQQAYMSLRSSLYYLAFKHLYKLTRADIPYPLDLRRRGLGISLLSAITLYENTQQLQDHVVSIPGVRSLLNQGDDVRGIPPNFWDNIHREFVRIKYRDLLQKGLTEWDRLSAEGRTKPTIEDPFLAYVTKELATNPVVTDMRLDNVFRKTARVIGYYLSRARDLMTGGVTEIEFQASKGFGNLMGAVAFRRGRLSKSNEWIRFVQARLQPGDILVESTPFRLTSTLIPGHFGHAALYVGEAQDLKKMKLDTEPHVRPHWHDVLEGKNIAEALRNGTQLNTLEHFLNIDDLAILRRKPGRFPTNEIREAISLAFSHLGKRYDFNFDTNTWDSIICSELIFDSYIHIPWTFGHGMASGTLTPDDIAIFAGSDDRRPFALITFIHDGAVVHDLPTNQINEESYIHLLGRHYDKAIGHRAQTNPSALPADEILRAGR